MKSIFRTLSILLFSTAFVSMLTAQGNPGQTTMTKVDKANQMTQDLNVYLNLDQKQTQSINQIHLNFLENMEKNRKNFDKKSPKARIKVLEKIKKLNQEKENNIALQLNEAQLTRYKRLLEDMKTVKREPLPANEHSPTENKATSEKQDH